MSKVAIKGAASGTATFTIESPATNTDRTLVLPDNAGTVITTATTTGLNASALSTGTVAPARLGTGNPGAGNFLRGDGAWQAAGGVANVQTFDANGTWNKPASGSMARIQVWGGGGGGGRQGFQTQVAGGGGGGYNEITVSLSTLASSVAVTIGAGGAGRSGAAGFATPGGQTTFGTIVGAEGGTGPGTNQNLSTGGQPLMSDLTRGHGLSLGNDFSGGQSQQNSGGQSVVYGGAGGGTVESFIIQPPGKSFLGGFGGAASMTATAENGQAPGGGGGGANDNQNGGDGGAGRVIVTVW